MKYYWTTLFNTGRFNYFCGETEEDCKKKAVRFYCGKIFDMGETTEHHYKQWLKYNKKEE